jgi:hypothetical protein
MTARYKPSKGDIAFRDLTKEDNQGDNPFEVAIALRSISDEYLSVLMADNQGNSSKPFLRQVEFEVERRAADRSVTANWIALGGMAVAALAIVSGVLFP